MFYFNFSCKDPHIPISDSEAVTEGAIAKNRPANLTLNVVFFLAVHKHDILTEVTIVGNCNKIDNFGNVL